MTKPDRPTDPVDSPGSTAPYRPGFERIAQRVLEYVAENNHQPGDRLPTEQQLAELFGTSRNVVRDAVKVLSAMGRVSVRKGAGIFVAEPFGSMVGSTMVHYQPTSLSHILMLTDYRRLIEGETARRAATFATPAQVRAITQSAAASNSTKSSTVRGFADADAHFHTAIAGAADNIFLESSVTTLRHFASQSDRMLFQGDPTGSFDVATAQHVAIAEAISRGDAALASELMMLHIGTTQEQFENRVQQRVFLDSEPEIV